MHLSADLASPPRLHDLRSSRHHAPKHLTLAQHRPASVFGISALDAEYILDVHWQLTRKGEA
jgi:hypothetical protein